MSLVVTCAFSYNKWFFYPIPFNGSCCYSTWQWFSTCVFLKTKTTNQNGPSRGSKRLWLNLLVSETPAFHARVSIRNSNSKRRGGLLSQSHIIQTKMFVVPSISLKDAARHDRRGAPTAVVRPDSTAWNESPEPQAQGRH